MPTPTENFSAISFTLEKDILPTIPYQQYQRSLLYRIFGGYEPSNDQQDFYYENTTIGEGAQGTRMVNNTLSYPIITGQTGGAGAMDSSLTAGYGTVPGLQGVLNLTNQQVGFTIGENVLLSPGVVKDTLAMSIQQGANASAMDAERQLFGDGTGLISTAAATHASPTTTLLLTASTNNDLDYAQFIAPNTVIKIGTNQPVTVVAYTAKNTVTISQAQTWTQGDAVLKATYNGNTGTFEYIGLGGIIGTGAYGSLTDPSWVSPVTTFNASYAGAGGNAALTSLFVSVNEIGRSSTIIMNKTLFTSYGNSLTSLQQFHYDDPLYAGWPVLDFMAGNAKVVLDYYAPDSNIYVLSPSSLWMAVLSPLHWLTGTEGVLNRIPGTANYEAVATAYQAAFCNVRAAQGIMTGVTA